MTMTMTTNLTLAAFLNAIRPAREAAKSEGKLIRFSWTAGVLASISTGSNPEDYRHVFVPPYTNEDDSLRSAYFTAEALDRALQDLARRAHIEGWRLEMITCRLSLRDGVLWFIIPGHKGRVHRVAVPALFYTEFDIDAGLEDDGLDSMN
jgi:hypothetical protein